MESTYKEESPCVGCGKATFGRCCIKCIIKRGTLRRLAIVTLRVSGMTCKEIGRIFKVGPSTIRLQLRLATQENFRTVVYGQQMNIIPRKGDVYDERRRSK